MNKKDNQRKIKSAITLEGRRIKKIQETEKIEENIEQIKNKKAELTTEESKKDTFFEERKEQKISKNIVRTFSVSCYKTSMVQKSF